MELNDFLKRPCPEKYQFEQEELKEEEGYRRYFLYVASKPAAKKSIYETGKKFAENTLNIPDCDGTLGNSEMDTCMLARDIYRSLWGWEDCNNEKLQRYGCIGDEKFEKLGPDTMHSATRRINDIISKALKECDEDSIVSIRKGKISNNLIIELFCNDKSKEWLIKSLDEETGLKDFLDAYHTIGNFVLVPAYFNIYRNSKVHDEWTESLILLKYKQEEWMWRKNKIVWDKSLYNKYINKFFLWDYVVSVDTQSTLSLDDIISKIYRRGRFMVTMLKINKINSEHYEEIIQEVLNTDTSYSNYKAVIESIKTKKC